MESLSASQGIASARIPTSVTALGVTALVFASLGLLGGASGVLGLVMQRQTVASMRSMGAGGPDPDVAGMMEPVLALQEQTFWPTAALQVLFVLAAIALGTAGFIVLLRAPAAPRWGPALLVASGALAMLGTGLELYVQHLTMAVMGDVMTGVMADAPPAGMGPMMDRMMLAQRAISYVCVGGWLLIKLLFITWAALHLRTPAIAGLFGGPSILSARGD